MRWRTSFFRDDGEKTREEKNRNAGKVVWWWPVSRCLAVETAMDGQTGVHRHNRNVEAVCVKQQTKDNTTTRFNPAAGLPWLWTGCNTTRTVAPIARVRCRVSRRDTRMYCTVNSSGWDEVEKPFYADMDTWRVSWSAEAKCLSSCIRHFGK
jgi:hypothetical protein